MEPDRKRVLFTVTVMGTAPADVEEYLLAELAMTLELLAAGGVGALCQAVTVDSEWELCE